MKRAGESARENAKRSIELAVLVAKNREIKFILPGVQWSSQLPVNYIEIEGATNKVENR
jgi:hypothetical protein